MPMPEPEASILYEHDDNSVVFSIKGTEVLRIEQNGNVSVHGRKCGHDSEVFQNVCRFFKVVAANYPDKHYLRCNRCGKLTLEECCDCA